MLERLLGYKMITKAFLYAYEKHKKDKRKGTNIPYIVHPIDVASTLLKERNNSNVSDELIVAGLLHDVFEDTGASLKDIEEEFGKKVMILVKASSEPEEYKGESKDEKRKSWVDRKTHTIESIKKANRDAKLLSCADKLSNLRDIVNDKFVYGKKIWKRFNASPEEIKWYYQSMVKAYSSGTSIKDTTTFKIFAREVKTFFGEDTMRKQKKIFCEKCKKEYTQNQCMMVPICVDGFLEEWGIICPKNHKFEVDKEDV
jgi:(p)ppGpp synthase/HD superfamily hydrolase